jgi:hypothetical protein
MTRELILCILVAVDDEIQTAQFIIVARLLRNTENRLGERRKNRRARRRKNLFATPDIEVRRLETAGKETNEP